MCQSIFSQGEDIVVAVLILQIADLTVALLPNIAVSLCAIKVMQQGLHKGTNKGNFKHKEWRVDFNAVIFLTYSFNSVHSFRS